MKGPILEVPSSFVDPVQDPGMKDALFQEECRQDPDYPNQVLGLERMLRVKARTESVSDLPIALSETSAKVQLRVKAKDALVMTAYATAGESKEIAGLLEVRESDFSKKAGAAVAAATASESEGNLGLHPVIESLSMGVARVRSASAAVALCAAAVALTCPLSSVAVVAMHARNTMTPMHVAHNS